MSMAAVVLVHGGGHDARCWELVERELDRRANVPVLAVDLPGRGAQSGSLADLTLEACVRSVVAQIQIANLHRIVLVGHSMAGMIVPGVADALGPEVEARLVLIAANVAPPDRPILDTMPLPTRIAGGLLGRWPRPYRLPRSVARALFCNGMTDDQTKFVTERLVPEAGWLVREPVPAARAKVPTTWVLTGRDRVVPPTLQRRTIAALGDQVEQVVELDAPHDVMVSHPAELAEILASAAAAGPGPSDR